MNRATLFSVTMVLLSGMSATACGDDGGSSGAGASSATAECGVPLPKPCGGDLTGQWEIASSCVVGATSVLDCGGTLATTTVADVGIWTFGADGSFEATEVVALVQKLEYSPSCLASFASCADLEAKLTTGFMSVPGATDADVTCTAGSGCSCDATVRASNDGRGTYVVSGGHLTSTLPGRVSEDDFCVKGDTLTLVSDGSVQTARRKK